MADRQYKSAMEDEEIKRRGDMHKELLSMNLCPELSEEAALKIGVGSIEIGIDFCLEEETRVRVRSEHKVVIQKTGLRSQGAKAASLRGLGASPPADLLGNVAMGPRKMPKLGAAGADGAASGGCARAGAVRDARSPAPAPAPTCAASVSTSASASASASMGGDGGSGGGGGGGGGSLDILEGKLMNHLGRLRHYLGKLKGLDATRAQDCFAASNARAAASSAPHASVVGTRVRGQPRPQPNLKAALRRRKASLTSLTHTHLVHTHTNTQTHAHTYAHAHTPVQAHTSPTLIPSPTPGVAT
jgi:hypothetical protein